MGVYIDSALSDFLSVSQWFVTDDALLWALALVVFGLATSLCYKVFCR